MVAGSLPQPTRDADSPVPGLNEASGRARPGGVASGSRAPGPAGQLLESHGTVRVERAVGEAVALVDDPRAERCPVGGDVGAGNARVAVAACVVQELTEMVLPLPASGETPAPSTGHECHRGTLLPRSGIRSRSVESIVSCRDGRTTSVTASPKQCSPNSITTLGVVVGAWIRRKHGRMAWSQVRRRFCDQAVRPQRSRFPRRVQRRWSPDTATAEPGSRPRGQSVSQPLGERRARHVENWRQRAPPGRRSLA